ncbi:MAG TPA: VWA domain-containing protein [Spirochaetota bacterium]|nr:VWA domain-containing protein [Spirochaetota bacterium]HPJ35396.1 VWA domain-containing protein [Spirochaetota bacterium]
MGNIEFRFPLFLLLLIPYVLIIAYYIYGKIGRRRASIPVSSSSIIKRRESFRTRTYPYLDYLRFLSLLLLIVALAAPGRGVNYSSVRNNGIDIMIALDLSNSMQGKDFQPDNRLEVAKRVLTGFVQKRVNDRIGLVVFGVDAYLQSPLTIEHGIIKDIVADLDFGTIDGRGTAVGDAVALAASRMIDSKAKSRIVLLITDGESNRGEIDPETAAKSCAELGIKVYTVGIGKEGRVPYPHPAGALFPDVYENNTFNIENLKKIAEITGARFYRAESSGVFWENINDIDRLEKSEVEVRTWHEFYDRSGGFLIAGIALFFLEILLRSVFYRKVP